MKTEVDTSVTINGQRYVPENQIQTYAASGTIKIVILQRGWVMVGRLSKTGSDCTLHNASIIRTWGTTKGLGEIAQGGPTSSTKLDKCNGVVEFDSLTMVCSITCRESSWINVL